METIMLTSEVSLSLWKAITAYEAETFEDPSP